MKTEPVIFHCHVSFLEGGKTEANYKGIKASEKEHGHLEHCSYMTLRKTCFVIVSLPSLSCSTSVSRKGSWMCAIRNFRMGHSSSIDDFKTSVWVFQYLVVFQPAFENGPAHSSSISEMSSTMAQVVTETSLNQPLWHLLIYVCIHCGCLALCDYAHWSSSSDILGTSKWLYPM